MSNTIIFDLSWQTNRETQSLCENIGIKLQLLKHVLLFYQSSNIDQTFPQTALSPDHYSRLKALSTAFRCKVKLTIIPTTCIPFKHFLKTHCQWQYFQSMHNLTSRTLSHYQQHRNWSVNSAAEFPFLLQHFKNYSKGSRNWHVNSAAEIPLSHLVWLPSTFSNHSSRTWELAYNHWSRDPFLPP